VCCVVTTNGDKRQRGELPKTPGRPRGDIMGKRGDPKGKGERGGRGTIDSEKEKKKKYLGKERCRKSSHLRDSSPSSKMYGPPGKGLGGGATLT